MNKIRILICVAAIVLGSGWLLYREWPALSASWAIGCVVGVLIKETRSAGARGKRVR